MLCISATHSFFPFVLHSNNVPSPDKIERCSSSSDKIRMPAGHETYLRIADLQGWGYSNSNVRRYTGVLSLLQVGSDIFHGEVQDGQGMSSNYEHNYNYDRFQPKRKVLLFLL